MSPPRLERNKNGRLFCSFCFLSPWAQADALIIITVILRTAPVMPIMVRTVPVIAPIQGLLRSRLEIDHTTLGALAITWAVRITSGARDIGPGATVEGSGSTVTTL